MVASEIRESSVLAAIAECDRLGQEEFLRRYNFGKASKFRLVHQGKFYDSKAIAGVAHGFATNDFWTTARPFGGVGPGGAVPILEDLGFLVDRTRLLFELTKLKVDQTHGKPAPYQYVVLLWAIAHAYEGARRLSPLGDVRRDLSQLLAPFAIARTAPDPAIPWAALGNSAWWEHDNRGALGGLSQLAFWTVAQDEAFRAAAIDVIVRIVGDSEEMKGLLVQLGVMSREVVPHGIGEPV
jgi:hypothetical protein